VEAFAPNAWHLIERSGGDASDTDGKLGRASLAGASESNALQSLISPSGAKRYSNPCREDFAAGIEFAQGEHRSDHHSVEFADIGEKSLRRGPSLD
jgi:hypothetical protein